MLCDVLVQGNVWKAKAYVVEEVSIINLYGTNLEDGREFEFYYHTDQKL